MASSSAASGAKGAGRAPGGGTGFPGGALVAALCAAAVLLGWHFWKRAPGHGGMPPEVFRDAFALHLRRAPALPIARSPLNGVQGSPDLPLTAPKPGAPPAISPVLIDDSGALDPFFAALWRLEQAKSGGPAGGTPGVNPVVEPTHAGDQAAVMNGAPDAGGGAPGSAGGVPEPVVTILHYGDSPTTADLITGDARALLQARFGDAGRGFNLPAKPWAWYGHRGVTLSDSGWKPLTPMGSPHEGVYGLGGATLVGEPGAKSTFHLANPDQTEVELSYLAEPDGGSFRVSADDQELQTISTDAGTKSPADTPAFTTLKLPAGTKELHLEVASGTVKMLGADFRKGSSGLLYDSMGLNGASTTVMSRGLGKGSWGAELQHAKPALIVINYGTNESNSADFVNKASERELRLAVAKIRSALPDVPILVMTPMDRGERAGLNDIQTMDTIPQLVAIQKRAAADLHCGFFDTFDAMGGPGTMAAWYNGHPRLVSADLIHPTPQGALIVATALVNNLSLGYDRWKRLHGIVPAAAAALASTGSQAQEQDGRPATSHKGARVEEMPRKDPPEPLRLKTPDPKTPDTRDR